MQKMFKIALAVECVALLTSCVAAAYSVSTTREPGDFLTIYRTACISALIFSFSICLTMSLEEMKCKSKPLRFAVLRIFGSILVFLSVLSLSGWLFGTTTIEQVQMSAYRNLVIWLGGIPVILAAAMFFKPPMTAPESRAGE